jgi:hypothetical protein
MLQTKPITLRLAGAPAQVGFVIPGLAQPQGHQCKTRVLGNPLPWYPSGLEHQRRLARPAPHVQSATRAERHTCRAPRVQSVRSAVRSKRCACEASCVRSAVRVKRCACEALCVRSAVRAKRCACEALCVRSAVRAKRAERVGSGHALRLLLAHSPPRQSSSLSSAPHSAPHPHTLPPHCSMPRAPLAHGAAELQARCNAHADICETSMQPRAPLAVCTRIVVTS